MSLHLQQSGPICAAKCREIPFAQTHPQELSCTIPVSDRRYIADLFAACEIHDDPWLGTKTVASAFLRYPVCRDGAAGAGAVACADSDPPAFDRGGRDSVSTVAYRPGRKAVLVAEIRHDAQRQPEPGHRDRDSQERSQSPAGRAFSADNQAERTASTHQYPARRYECDRPSTTDSAVLPCIPGAIAAGDRPSPARSFRCG